MFVLFPDFFVEEDRFVFFFVFVLLFFAFLFSFFFFVYFFTFVFVVVLETVAARGGISSSIITTCPSVIQSGPDSVPSLGFAIQRATIAIRTNAIHPFIRNSFFLSDLTLTVPWDVSLKLPDNLVKT